MCGRVCLMHVGNYECSMRKQVSAILRCLEQAPASESRRARAATRQTPARARRAAHAGPPTARWSCLSAASAPPRAGAGLPPARAPRMQQDPCHSAVYLRAISVIDGLELCCDTPARPTQGPGTALCTRAASTFAHRQSVVLKHLYAMSRDIFIGKIPT